MCGAAWDKNVAAKILKIVGVHGDLNDGNVSYVQLFVSKIKGIVIMMNQ
jgi:hypothetical protein